MPYMAVRNASSIRQILLFFAPHVKTVFIYLKTIHIQRIIQPNSPIVLEIAKKRINLIITTLRASVNVGDYI
jgi:hypothetical protein